MHSILVPVDFSDCSHEVVRQAAELAQAFDATLELLHVIVVPAGLDASERILPDGPGSAPISVLAYLERDARSQLDPYAEIASAAPRVRSRLERGCVVDVILERAAELGAGMIVLGTHGRTGLARLTLGSVAKEVLRRAPCPVLTVRSVHHAGCEAQSCNWCASGITPAMLRVRGELAG
jgi:nucleotide-binding universal stress UspA family protein